ncbi:MAG: carboxypeptidase-like regulatory domain-containing protein [Solirubrobacterales bacterium]
MLWSLVVLVLCGFSLAAPTAAFAAGSISGTVTAATPPSDPLEGVEVCAHRALSYDIDCTVTGSSGEYTVADLVDGSYRVEFWPEESSNYIPQYFEEKFSWEEADIVVVEGGADVPNVDAALEEGGWIEGRVVDSVSKTGVADVRVCASPIDHFGFSRCAVTGSSGDYVLLGLATDSYMVGFVPVEGGVSDDYVWQFYDGWDSWFEPTPVAVSAGLGTTGIDAALERPGQIVGTVTDAASGSAIGSSRVCLFKLKENVEPWCTNTDNNGHYSFEGLSGGAYKVWFSPEDPIRGEEDDYFQQYYNGKSTFAEADTVFVGAGGTTPGIDARLVSRNPAPPTLSAAPLTHITPVKPRHKPRKHCRKGQRKVKKRGKVRCVKAHRQPHHRSGRGRSPID